MGEQFDFGIDEGIEIDSEFDEIDNDDGFFESGINSGNVDTQLSEYEEQMDEEEKTSLTKKAIHLVIAGAVIVIIGFSAFRVYNSAGKVKSNKEVKSEQEVISDSINREETEEKESEQANNESKVHEEDSTQNGDTTWVELKDAGIDKFDTTINSTFTVTDIKRYAKVTNSNNDVIVKAVVSGSISGLVGTYEMEVPYEKTIGLNIGDTLNVVYNITEINNSKIIEINIK